MFVLSLSSTVAMLYAKRFCVTKTSDRLRRFSFPRKRYPVAVWFSLLRLFLCSVHGQFSPRSHVQGRMAVVQRTINLLIIRGDCACGDAQLSGDGLLFWPCLVIISSSSSLSFCLVLLSVLSVQCNYTKQKTSTYLNLNSLNDSKSLLSRQLKIIVCVWNIAGIHLFRKCSCFI